MIRYANLPLDLYPIKLLVLFDNNSSSKYAYLADAYFSPDAREQVTALCMETFKAIEAGAEVTQSSSTSFTAEHSLNAAEQVLFSISRNTDGSCSENELETT